MPLTIPQIDDRNYQQLLDEALARIPVHNPEWTNFNKSDPGVTIIEVFAFLTENLLYRSNQIPERNRVKFLQLLGIPLRPASSARGLVTFSNERGPLQTFTLGAGLEVRAGVHTGECELMGDNIGGIAVHAGARIMAQAKPGEVVVSRTVKDLVSGSVPHRVGDRRVARRGAGLLQASAR